MSTKRNPIKQTIQAAIHAAQKTVRVAKSMAHKDSIRTQIFVGLNDGDAKEQRFDTDRYTSILKRVCVQYGVPFSFDIVNGGYIHDDGEYTEENTIVLTFIDAPQKAVDEIAEDLCVFFRQESVLITSSPIQSRTIRRLADE
jgi:hypothetical protein